MDYRRYRVNPRSKGPLLGYLIDALDLCGCRVIHASPPDEAPFRVTFDAPDGERMGIIAYAFYANQEVTKNRPDDEHRFQVKYGSKDGERHVLWQDPDEPYTTLFLGINPERGFFVAADPVLHNPTRFFISIEFKDENVQKLLEAGWLAWERASRSKGLDQPVEVLIGATPGQFLRYVRFERAAKGHSTGHRALLADKFGMLPQAHPDRGAGTETHTLASELDLDQNEILDLIQSAPRLKMAVRGWVAGVHLERLLRGLPEVSACERIEEDGQPDLRVRIGAGPPLTIECKNVLRRSRSDGTARVDFQRTRASKSDPCSRFYRPTDFEILAACLHPCTEQWQFRFIPTRRLDAHKHCAGRLSNRVVLDDRWTSDPLEAIRNVPPS